MLYTKLKIDCSLIAKLQILILYHYAARPSACSGTPFVSFPLCGQQFTITWDEPPLNMGETFDAFFLNISGPDDLCGSVNTLLRFGSSTHSYTCSGCRLPGGQRYTFIVQAANCGWVLRGPKSGPATVSLQCMYICLCNHFCYWY